MIRYPIAIAALKKLIREHTPTRRKSWFVEAEELLDDLPDEPEERDFKNIWGDVKGVYIELQHSKCAFCEQCLEGPITQDVEHFRPKTAVTHWAVPAKLASDGITASQRADGNPEKGYRLLAYHILNYAMACKNCNSIFKRNLFPITKARRTDAKNPPSPPTERNYLIYPISDIDDDPEAIIEFEGLMPVPKGGGFNKQRAQVCIELFKLDDETERKTLIKDRAEMIQLLYFNLRAIADSADAALKNVARQNRDQMLHKSHRHANCLRSFSRLFGADRAVADKVFEDLSVLLSTMSK